MIASNTLKIDHENRADQPPPVYLAPFGESELAHCMPLATDNLYFSKSLAAVYKQTPAALAATHKDLEHSQNWGIYRGEVSPEAFQGVISLSEVDFGDPVKPQYTRLLQETGLYIMRPAARHTGLGSLARLAVMSHALEAQGTRAFRSITSERNIASQKSLAKTGFAFLGTLLDYVHFPGGEAAQHWVAAHPDAQASVASSGDIEADALATAWKQYETQRQQLNITEL